MIRRGPGPAGVRAAAAGPPRSVAELAATSAGWKVELGDFGRWLIAEHQVERGGRRWLLGLTPVRREVVAMVLWRDDVVVGHARGSEAEMCALAHGTLVRIASDSACATGVPGGLPDLKSPM